MHANAGGVWKQSGLMLVVKRQGCKGIARNRDLTERKNIDRSVEQSSKSGNQFTRLEKTKIEISTAFYFHVALCCESGIFSFAGGGTPLDAVS